MLTSHGLATEYDIALRAATYCRRVRDQYAHCNWRDHPDAGLFFTDLTEAAARDGIFTFVWRHIDPPLLEQQAAFFAHALEWLTYLDVELAVRADKMSIASWPRPPEQEAPPLCNPLAEHVPPWLSKREKERHAARV
jgi:hypothetical protein